MAAPEENAYEILGLDQGPAATDGEIRKARTHNLSFKKLYTIAYRALALLKHPDKNRDNPRAADEFTALQRAYELLTDEEGRKALDDLLRARAARAERTVIHDHKRRRMAEDLIRREQAAEGLSAEAQAKARLAAEIARMRKAAQEREAKQRASQQAAASPGYTEGGTGHHHQQQQHPGMAPAAPGGDVADALPRTLKVSWVRPGVEYDAVELRKIFSVHGSVEDVVMREGKKRKGSALVVMATKEGTRKAGENVNGEISNPLLVVPLTKGSDATEKADNGGEKPYVASSSGYVDHKPQQSEQPMNSDLKGKKVNEVRPAGRSLGPRPMKPLFPAGAHASASRLASASFSGFSSFQQPPGPGNGKGEGQADVKRKQADARQRIIEQLREEDGADA